LADESVDRQIVEQLRNEGHDVLYIAEIDPSIPDELVFDLANKNSSLLLTGNKDFGELVFRDGRLVSDGVILLRLEGLSAEMKSQLVSDAIQRYAAELSNRFTVIAPGRIRIRTDKH
jgi:predicted nuclease of predicted toxin-antitoxin system